MFVLECDGKKRELSWCGTSYTEERGIVWGVSGAFSNVIVAKLHDVRCLVWSRRARLQVTSDHGALQGPALSGFLSFSYWHMPKDARSFACVIGEIHISHS